LIVGLLLHLMPGRRELGTAEYPFDPVALEHGDFGRHASSNGDGAMEPVLDACFAVTE
jgi:hypothetical protein